MKKTFFTLLLVAIGFAAYAQEQAIYSQYQVFPVLVNPGLTGFDNQHQLLVNARNSWSGFPGAPQSYTVLYHGPVGNNLALGGGVFAEKIGDQNLFRLQLNYAYRIQSKDQKFRAGIGLTTEFIRRSINNDLLSDPTVNPNDPTLEDLANGQQIFDASVGIHTLFDNRFFVSLALPNAIRARLDEVPVQDNTTDSGLLSHYMFQLGYIADVSKQGFKLIPSLAIRNFRNVPYQVDLNLQGRFLDEKLIAGFTYRPGSANGSLAFLLGTKFNSIQAFYSYDVNFGNFQQYNGGSHELSLALGFDRKEKIVVPN
ncbi:MAG: PorP/SprF family type IX secretion system membrane protein [Lewinellaceae bacterium]|nr:PorP/SprF family type IX secretion system membrane protein [Lewinellaceae bacterium]